MDVVEASYSQPFDLNMDVLLKPVIPLVIIIPKLNS